MSVEELYEIYCRFPCIQTDSRKLAAGEIYIALKGEHFNGNAFVKDALNKGASYAIIDDEAFNCSDKCIVVDDVLSCLQALALHHRSTFSVPFIAITGSNGKTTTKELILTVLSTTYKTYATMGNLNNHIGIPLTLLQIRRDAEMAIIEMGANHQHEIEGYCKMVLPTHALITNCGKAHLEGFGGLEGVRKGKGELYDFIRCSNGTLFRNSDLDYLNDMATGISKQVTYGTNSADFTGIPVMKGPFAGAEITTSGDECVIWTQLVGTYNFANIMSAFAIGRTMHIGIDAIKDALEAYTPDNSRSQMITIGSNTIILDAYNANPTSMAAAIQNFADSGYSEKVVIIGGMKELGAVSIEEHQKIILLLEQTNWHHVVLVGGDFAHVTHRFTYFANSAETKVWFDKQQFKNTALLIKGSRAFQMEKVIQD